jgi:hypothetical protein
MNKDTLPRQAGELFQKTEGPAVAPPFQHRSTSRNEWRAPLHRVAVTLFHRRGEDA